MARNAEREKQIAELLARHQSCQEYRKAAVLGLIRGLISMAIMIFLAVSAWSIRQFYIYGPGY